MNKNYKIDWPKK
jgi:hypothetical protein